MFCLFGLIVAPGRTNFAQTSGKPLSKQEVIDLLTADLPSSKVGGAARQFGISFQVTTSVEGELRDAGANDSLIKTLKELAPKPANKPETETPVSPPVAGPPILMIQSHPGGAQVYVDDEPVATTSPQGRLKLSQLSPGQHSVRLALSGYQDFEQQVSLTNGQTTKLEASLQSSKAVVQPAPPPSNPEPAAGQSGVRGTLGFLFRKAPEGERGVVVLAVVPGGPAERIGLLPGFVVDSVAGHDLTANPDVMNALSGHPPGDAVEVVFSNGVATLKARAVVAPISIIENLPHFRVVHDHGPPAPNYCMGEMLIVGRSILYEGREATSPSGPSDTVHHLDFQASQIAEARKNAVYMAAQGAFHIRTRNAQNANFILVGPTGRYVRPDPVLSAIAQAMARR
ncbi:MAG: hypothetical protein DMG21_11635 [Acidobacteria bacterium]|nr:MAG: hypothetical protein DMG21_11635 [Acidobacteriota bacterium]